MVLVTATRRVVNRTRVFFVGFQPLRLHLLSLILITTVVRVIIVVNSHFLRVSDVVLVFFCWGGLGGGGSDVVRGGLLIVNKCRRDKTCLPIFVEGVFSHPLK